jgi:hypothetical protein
MVYEDCVPVFYLNLPHWIGQEIQHQAFQSCIAAV